MVDGKEYLLPLVLGKVRHGTFNPETGIVTYYDMRGDNE